MPPVPSQNPLVRSFPFQRVTRLLPRTRNIFASTWLWTAAILLVAVALRIPGMFCDFWGDEIWSWQIAGQLHGITDVLLSPIARSDNSHPLNTLWLYFLGGHSSVWLYRLPAMLAGVGTVAVGMHCMFRRGQVAGISAGVLTAISFPLVFYSSEARGYSLAVFFAVLAFDALDAVLTGGAGWWTWVFTLACVLGFLSHLTFLHVYAASIAWSVYQLRGRWRPLLTLHAAPLVFLGIYSLVFILPMVIVGAPPTNPRVVCEEVCSLTLGGPTGDTIGCLAAAVLAVLLFLTTIILLKEKCGSWLFYIVVFLISPTLATIHELTMSTHRQPLMVRYFLVCVPFILLPLGPFVQALLQRRRFFPTAVVIVATFAFFIGNAIHLGRFWPKGRGNPFGALAHIAGVTRGPIEITSDNLPPTRMLLSFYSPRLSPPRDVQLRDEPVEWLIVNRLTPDAHHAVLFRGVRYVLDSVYPSGELSGWTWIVYRRAEMLP